MFYFKVQVAAHLCYEHIDKFMGAESHLGTCCQRLSRNKCGNLLSFEPGIYNIFEWVQVRPQLQAHILRKDGLEYQFLSLHLVVVIKLLIFLLMFYFGVS
ncbi:hypothetical protein RHGRI_038105 [Rhododendron griersonianum]|uniref:Uncharacterized protein n=1 Tax=Rhododendron griersonianum TaxID=479676 RepID=A0AAV6HX76_9ERIC|nr:hypothetical protein RHGRI_038105 [Rhododendron griersonianum]